MDDLTINAATTVQEPAMLELISTGVKRKRVTMKAELTLASVALGLAVIAFSAKATVLNPGDAGPPDAFSLGFSDARGATVLASKRLSWQSSSGALIGQFYEQVVSDPGNVFCSGCLIFQLQFDNRSGAGINVVSTMNAGFMNSFGSYRTDVGYELQSVGSVNECGPDDNGFCNSGNPNTIPSSVSRSLDGNIVGFNFSPGFTLASVGLVIETNATSFIDPEITISGSNGEVARLNAFGPSGPPVQPVSVSEPTTTALLGIALAALGFRRRNFRIGYK